MVLAVLAAGAGYLFLPRPGEFLRQRVEQGLEKKLDAKVKLGRFRVLGTRQFLLNDMEIREMAGQPRLDSLIAAEIQVEGGVRDILQGRFERMEVRGLDLRLQEPKAPPAGGPPAEFAAKTLSVQRGRVFFPEPFAEVVAFSADLAGVGTRLSGEVRFNSSELDLAAVGRLAAGMASLADPGLLGRALRLDGRMRWPADSTGWSFQMKSGEIAAALRNRPPLPALQEIRMEVEPRGKVYHLKVESGMEDGGHVQAAVDIDGQGKPGEATVRVEKAALETWSPWLRELVPGLSAIGVLDAEVTHRPDAAWEFGIRARGEVAAEKKRALQGAVLELNGSIDSIRPLSPMGLHGSVEIQNGVWSGAPLPVDDLFPLRVSLDGQITAAVAPGLAGTLRVDSARDGRALFHGRLSLEDQGLKVQGSWNWEEERIERLIFWGRNFSLNLPKGQGKVRAEGSLEGTWPDIAAQADLFWSAVQTEEGEKSTWDIQQGEGRARLLWKNGMEIREFETAGMVRTLGLAPLIVKIRGRGSWDPASGKARIAEGELSLPDSEPWGFSGVWEGRSARGVLDMPRLSLPPWRERLLPLIGEMWGAGSIEGSAGLHAEGEWSPGEGWRVSGTGGLAGVGWSSADGASVVQGPDIAFKVWGQGGGKEDAGPKGGMAADWKNFQVLRGGFFGDYSTVHGTLNLDFEMREDQFSARFDLAVPGALGIRGEAGGDRQAGLRAAQATLEAPDLGTAFRNLIQGPLADAVPVLGRMTVEGGLRAEGAWERAGGNSGVRGRVRLNDARVAGARETIEVESLNLDLPFEILFPISEESPKEKGQLTGNVSFQGLRAGGVDIPGLSTVLITSGDSLSVGAAVTIPLFGGGVMLDHLHVNKILRPERQLEFDLILSGMRLDEVARDLGFLPLGGELNAQFRHVSLSPEKLEVDGGGEMALFGGKIWLHSISGSDILTRYPKVNFQVDFQDIDLGQVTRAFDFGEMTGLVSGWARPVELFGWVPVKFTAQIATVPRRGVPRRINVKAINNVAILGTGSRITLLDRGLQRFFQHYTYDALGMSLSLNNDVFLVRGLEHRGARELFLRGRLPFPIDVVNADPGRTVSFRAMLDRFSALEVKSVRVGRAR